MRTTEGCMRTIILPQAERRTSISIGGGPGAPIFQPGPQTRIYRAPVRAVCAVSQAGGEESWGQVLDVSLGGCLLKIDARYPLGSVIDLRITLVGDGRRSIADVRGAVRRVEDEAEHALYGIELLAETTEERRVLQWLYAQALR